LGNGTLDIREENLPILSETNETRSEKEQFLSSLDTFPESEHEQPPGDNYRQSQTIFIVGKSLTEVRHQINLD